MADWLAASFESYGWATSRGFSGREAVVRFYEDWETVAFELCSLHTGPLLRIPDLRADWEATLGRIDDAVTNG